MSIWQRLRRRLRGQDQVSEAEPIDGQPPVVVEPAAIVEPAKESVPAPLGRPRLETPAERLERLKLERELSAIELAIADIESCLIALDAREQHRNDDLGPIALA
ncbi:MAG: hypothetical protein KC431_16810, partial [Myxococcales bacterium]|nr:hypothetical protein [Myxococcales bacterium]